MVLYIWQQTQRARDWKRENLSVMSESLLCSVVWRSSDRDGHSSGFGADLRVLPCSSFLPLCLQGALERRVGDGPAADICLSSFTSLSLLSPLILLQAVSIQVVPVSGSTPPHHSLGRTLFQDAFNLHCILGVAACCKLQMRWWGEFFGGTPLLWRARPGETHFTGLQVDGLSLLSVREVRRQMKTRKLNRLSLKLKWKKGL